MTDRELLELAAKAAGYEDWKYCEPVPGEPALYIPKAGGVWMPHHDDGDAFRLMVEKRFTVKVEDHEVEVFDEWGECLVSIGMQTDEDYRAATRLAITRAAAETQLQEERNESI